MEKTKRVALLMLPLAFLLFISFSYALEIIATVKVIGEGMDIEVLTPIFNGNYSSYIPLNFTIDKEITYASYSLDNGEKLDVTDNTTYNGSQTIGFEKIKNITDGSHNITLFANDTSGDGDSSETIEFFYCFADMTGLIEGVPDGITNMRDIGYACSKFMTKPGDDDWDPDVDLNGDDVVNMRDIGTTCSEFMKTCP